MAGPSIPAAPGQKRIEINITAWGDVSVEAIGFNGKGCADATEQIEIALGGNAPGNRKKNPKPEMFAPAGASATNKLAF